MQQLRGGSVCLNMVNGRSWLTAIIDGKTFSEIAEVESVSTARVQDLTNLALRAPDVLGRIATGEQPDGLTTDDPIKARFSAVWSEQHRQIAAL